MKKLPETVYVRRDEEEDYLLANEELVYSIEDDGPTIVGVYELVREVKATKRVDVAILRTVTQKSHSSIRK